MAGESRVFRPDRRQFLQIGACASAFAIPLLAGAGQPPSDLRLHLSHGRARPGARVEVEARSSGDGEPRRALVVRLARSRESLELLDEVALRPSAEGTWTGTFVVPSNPPDVQGGETYLLAVLGLEGGKTVLSDVLEVICTPLLAGF